MASLVTSFPLMNYPKYWSLMELMLEYHFKWMIMFYYHDFYFKLKKLRKELHFYICKDIAIKILPIYFSSPIPIVFIYVFTRLLNFSWIFGTAPFQKCYQKNQ